MALGMCIGAGLFLGSASTIKLAGPSVLFAYLFGGAMIFIIMRALGEMAVHDPVAGSFSTYAHKYLGPFAGYLTGWNYWILMMGVGIAESTAVGIYMKAVVSRSAAVDMGVRQRGDDRWTEPDGGEGVRRDGILVRADQGADGGADDRSAAPRIIWLGWGNGGHPGGHVQSVDARWLVPERGDRHGAGAAGAGVLLRRHRDDRHGGGRGGAARSGRFRARSTR